MSCQEEVLKIGKKLEKMTKDKTDSSTALDLLNALKKLPMTLDVLQKTGIGMKVNSFRKSCEDEQVVSLAKVLIKSWKKLLSDSNNSTSAPRTPPSLVRSGSTVSTSSSLDLDQRSQSPQEQLDGSLQADEGEGASPNGPPGSNGQLPSDGQWGSGPTPTHFPYTASETKDAVRLKCREMLSTALRGTDIPDGALDPDQLAASVEDCIYKEFKNTDSKYKTRVRSRVLNLKDSKNPSLRENVLVGSIRVEQFAKMSPEEMASKEMKALRDKYTKESISDHQMAVNEGTKTTLLKCGKCSRNNVTYSQIQTRSADEPMTTFCLCNECGHRWKFC